VEDAAATIRRMEQYFVVDETKPLPWTPRAILDAGGEAWTTLSAVIGRLVDEIATDAVLEIVSLEPSLRADLTEWCGASGHEVLGIRENGGATQIWIRKLADTPQGPRGGIEVE